MIYTLGTELDRAGTRTDAQGRLGDTRGVRVNRRGTVEVEGGGRVRVHSRVMGNWPRLEQKN